MTKRLRWPRGAAASFILDSHAVVPDCAPFARKSGTHNPEWWLWILRCAIAHHSSPFRRPGMTGLSEWNSIMRRQFISQAISTAALLSLGALSASAADNTAVQEKAAVCSG